MAAVSFAFRWRPVTTANCSRCERARANLTIRSTAKHRLAPVGYGFVRITIGAAAVTEATTTSASAREGAIGFELLLLVVLATLWGGSYTFIKLGVATIPPVTLIAGRTLIAAMLLLVIMAGRGVRMPDDAATWRRFLFQACLNSVIPWTLIAWAERSVDAGLATILNSTSPIFTFFLTLVVAHQDKPSWRKLFGVVAGMAGICLIIGVQALHGFGEQLVAQVAIVVATICYAGGALFSRGFKGLDPIAPAAGSLLCGAAILLPVSMVAERPWNVMPSATSLLALAGLAAFSTAIA